MPSSNSLGLQSYTAIHPKSGGPPTLLLTHGAYRIFLASLLGEDLRMCVLTLFVRFDGGHIISYVIMRTSSIVHFHVVLFLFVHMTGKTSFVKGNRRVAT